MNNDIMSNNNRCNNDVKKDDRIITHPIKLSGLRQAIYIIKCLGKDEYPDQIAEKFEI